MDQNAASKPARPRLNPYTKALRRERIFSRLRLGWPYEKIALWEGVKSAAGPEDRERCARAPAAG